MSNPYFHFKQFTIWHDKTAMKVGTDSVMLGSWALVENGDLVLDIGTGTGIIALMLAQRGAGIVDCVEVDIEACNQASNNVSLSPWADNIHIIHSDIVDYSLTTTKLYKRIISNPPYFNNSLVSPLSKRTVARHAIGLTWELLIGHAWKMLQVDGTFSVVLPWPDAKQFIKLAVIQGFYQSKVCLISPKVGKEFNRVMLEFSKYSSICCDSTIYIRDRENQYTSDYQSLTADFYLAF